MNQKQEREIIKVLASTDEALAKRFARSRGYGVKTVAAKTVEIGDDAAKNRRWLDGLPEGTVITWFDKTGYHDSSLTKRGKMWHDQNYSPHKINSVRLGRELADEAAIRETLRGPGTVRVTVK